MSDPDDNQYFYNECIKPVFNFTESVQRIQDGQKENHHRDPDHFCRSDTVQTLSDLIPVYIPESARYYRAAASGNHSG